MAIALLTNAISGSTPGPNTTAAVDTTGAVLLVLGMSSISGNTLPTITDNKAGNTWNLINTKGASDGSNVRTALYYCIPVSVGAGHTVTATGGTGFPNLTLSVWSGTAAASSLDQSNVTVVNSTTGQTGNITPTQNDELIITFMAGSDGGSNFPSSTTINSGMTKIGSIAGFGQQQAYVVQGPAAAINPTWTWTPSLTANMHIASFKNASPSSSATFPALRVAA